MNLQQLIQLSEPASHSIFLQIEQIKDALTQSQKPYFHLTVADESLRTSLKIWADTEAFNYCETSFPGDCIELTATFFTNQFGLNLTAPTIRQLNSEEKSHFFQGSSDQIAMNQRDWDFLIETFHQLDDPRLRLITTNCLQNFEAKWRRAAAARTYHHARRGGLLEHTSQMLRIATGVAPLYPEITPDLLYSGVLFHDIGKLWENDYGEESFILQTNRTGELIGHINIGIEVVNKLWHEAAEAHPEYFFENKKETAILRDHLLHLIVSHHGELAFGAPVTPRIPEAWLLHHIDNMDARMEMMRCTYREKPETIPGLFEPRRPLTGMVATPFSQIKQNQNTPSTTFDPPAEEPPPSS